MVDLARRWLGGRERRGAEFPLISIREASEELSFGDGVGVVLIAAWKCGGRPLSCRAIVGAGQADNEAVLSRGEVVVCNGVKVTLMSSFCPSFRS